jgi:hypothetical protein
VTSFATILGEEIERRALEACLRERRQTQRISWPSEALTSVPTSIVQHHQETRRRQLKREFRAAVRATHPDRGGSAAAFTRVVDDYHQALAAL